MEDVKTKEQILESKADGRYNIGMPFHFSHIYEAMDEWERQQTSLLQAENEKLKAAMQEFVDRVEKGEVRSKRTYAKFKSLLTPASVNNDSVTS